ncbi:MAG: hypothetical protein ACK5GU_06865 [Chloroflexota bacterium]|jgi:septal ring factor EnvC (AmiA/AmiB activator)
MRALSIVLGILLLASLAGNTVLGTLVLDYNRQIIELQNTVAQKQTRINEIVTQYNEATEQIKSANNVITTQQNDIARLLAAEETYKRDLNNYRDRLSKADYFVSRAKCPVMVDELKAFAATKNEDVRSSVLTALRAMYDGTVIRSSFAPIWNADSKTTMLTTSWNDGLTKTIIAWTNNQRSIQTIYDINAGCVMYTGDR